MWYALFKNNEIISVQKFGYTPTIYDFKCYFNTFYNYNIKKVQIKSEDIIYE